MLLKNKYNKPNKEGSLRSFGEVNLHLDNQLWRELGS
jgi:hypothetical protein